MLIEQRLRPPWGPADHLSALWADDTLEREEAMSDVQFWLVVTIVAVVGATYTGAVVMIAKVPLPWKAVYPLVMGAASAVIWIMAVAGATTVEQYGFTTEAFILRWLVPVFFILVGGLYPIGFEKRSAKSWYGVARG